MPTDNRQTINTTAGLVSATFTTAPDPAAADELVVLDKRRRGFFILDNEVIDAFANAPGTVTWTRKPKRPGTPPQRVEIRRALGPQGIAVYAVLVRMADRASHKARPSLGAIADMLGMSRRQVIREVERLQAVRLVRVTTNRKPNSRELAPSTYELLPVTKTRLGGDSQSLGSDSQSLGSDSQSQNQESFQDSTPRATRTASSAQNGRAVAVAGDHLSELGSAILSALQTAGAKANSATRRLAAKLAARPGMTAERALALFVAERDAAVRGRAGNAVGVAIAAMLDDAYRPTPTSSATIVTPRGES